MAKASNNRFPQIVLAEQTTPATLIQELTPTGTTTAPITQTDLVLSTGNYETGSVLRLYGES
jgi:hypothetical protein